MNNGVKEKLRFNFKLMILEYAEHFGPALG